MLASLEEGVEIIDRYMLATKKCAYGEFSWIRHSEPIFEQAMDFAREAQEWIKLHPDLNPFMGIYATFLEWERKDMSYDNCRDIANILSDTWKYGPDMDIADRLMVIRHELEEEKNAWDESYDQEDDDE